MAHHDQLDHHEDHEDHEIEDHDRGLSYDLPTLLNRRRALSLLGGAGLVAALAACGAGSDDPTMSGERTGQPPGGGPDAGGTGAGGPGGAPPEGGGPGAGGQPGGDPNASTADGEIPEETAGPFPGDGSNGVNVLSESGIIRSDITTSFGSASGVAAGVPLTIKLTVLDTGNGSAALAGAAVYLWHCNIDGEYSLYSDAIADENYLRGVQETNANGEVTFTSIFPAAYSGRWPHIHFEVYESLAAATKASSKLRTSQLALPKEACDQVYATDGYSQSVTNLAQTSLDSDMVFSDGYSLQLAKITGNVTDGMTATLNVPV
jgi:protocatechuate 3,4-dioxygenase beta subunit